MNGVAAFWAARNGRERILIGVAAALALLLLLVTPVGPSAGAFRHPHL